MVLRFAGRLRKTLAEADNRPLVALLPATLALRDEIQREQRYPVAIRVGAAGGIGTPQAVLAAFKAALARDKTPTQVFEISELGLVEMTRKRVGEGLVETMSETCPMCNGRGIVFRDGPN